ncbi:hypothetical protein [Rhodocyclus tenuis]|uniref:MotA/TolQ/ExbB proton channel domain-containing protein n=1 Tax=Rhodocyclus tenuis TaxID=1066 RepID=A0A840G8X8_RHOTE|nr:hypothetical protein [Rhodocyclus tenuis]MBB4247360.1 hypothetical protein [Rhodocyclus tenuis]
MIKYLALMIITSIVTYLLRDSLSLLKYEAYKDTLGALLNVSSIIFAIIGAWIAIIYPRAIGRAFASSNIKDNEIKEAEGDANYLSELVEIVMVSAFVLMTVLTIQFSVPITKGILGPTALKHGKYAIFFTVATLTFIQLHAVFRVILANYFFLNQLRNKNASGKIDVLNK